MTRKKCRHLNQTRIGIRAGVGINLNYIPLSHIAQKSLIYRYIFLIFLFTIFGSFNTLLYLCRRET